jgi:uncharacterized protein YlxW (UPF0749 family)
MLTSMLIAFILLSHHTSAMAAQLDQTSKLIKEKITDKPVQDTALKIVSAMQEQVKSYTKEIEGENKTLTDLLANRSAPAADIERELHTMLAADSVNTAKLLDLRFRMTGVLNASQWAAIHPATKTP